MGTKDPNNAYRFDEDEEIEEEASVNEEEIDENDEEPDFHPEAHVYRRSSRSATDQFEMLPTIVKVLALLALGAPFSGIFRILRFIENKNILTLVIGVLCFTVIGYVLVIVDILTEIFHKRIELFAE